MRDYVVALRAVWRCWQTGERLSVDTGHYTLNLMVPLFDPGPIDHPEIPIHLAAIGPNMCALAGEVADGIRLHPVCSPRFIDEAVMPALTVGAARAGRSTDDIEVCLKPLIATAPDGEALARVTEIVRARVAFYLSTPSYRRAFEIHGWGDIARHASELARAKRWDQLPDLVHDEMLHTVAAVGTHDEIADKLEERYGPRVDRLEFSIPVADDHDAETLASIIDRLHACPPRTEHRSDAVELAEPDVWTS
jgi:probable F420-dependent oxidoreductase